MSEKISEAVTMELSHFTVYFTAKSDSFNSHVFIFSIALETEYFSQVLILETIFSSQASDSKKVFRSEELPSNSLISVSVLFHLIHEYCSLIASAFVQK
jgi:hypothetical protein